MLFFTVFVSAIFHLIFIYSIRECRKHKDLQWFQNLSTVENKSDFSVVLLPVGSCGKEKEKSSGWFSRVEYRKE